MKRLPAKHYLHGISSLLLAGSFVAAPMSAITAGEAHEGGRYEWLGSVTFQFDGHIYEDGFRDGQPEFITRYTPLRSYGGDDYPGYFIDVARLRIEAVDQETGRRVFGLDRRSLAYFNQKNAIFFDPEPIRLDLSHSLYRSQQFRSRNLPDPAGGNSIFAVFNDDSIGRTDFFVRRSDFDIGLKIRPSAYAHDASHMGDVNVLYHRSDRDSVRYFDYVLTRRLAGGADFNQVRWRGIDQRVVESVNGGGLSLSATPFQQILVTYDIYAEKYRNRFNNSTLADVARAANVPITPDSTVAPSPRDTGPGTFIDRHSTELWPVEQVSLGWVPSTTKLINKIKFQRYIGPATLNFGYANVFLDADTFTPFALDRGYDRSQIITHSAFGNWQMPLARTIRWNAHVNYQLRDNRSTFPALDPQNRPPFTASGQSAFDYMNPLLDGGKHGGVFAPFINQIATVKVGTDFTFMLPVASSRLHTGWEYEDISRDLIFGNPPPGEVRSIDPHEAFVRSDSANHTLFANYSARPIQRLQFRWNNALKLGDKVALVTEPETGFKSRVGLSYYLPDILKGATIDGYYQVRYSENDAFVIRSINPASGALVSSAQQDREKLFQSAGLTFTIMPLETWTAYSGYQWHRDSLEANFMRTDRRRYEAPWTLTALTRSRYVTDAHTGFVGTSYQFTKRLLGTLDYSITAIIGELGSGEVETVLGRDNELDNITHHVATGLNYQIRPNWSIGGRYAYAVYHDKVNRALDSGYHVIGAMATLSF